MIEAPTTLVGWIGLIAVGVPAFLFVITFIVFVHEMGHFLAARWCRVRIDSFSVGFGRELIGVTDKYGTRWKISALPFGGFVKFWGDEGVSSRPDHEVLDHAAAAERAQSFHFKPLYQKSLIAVAGPIANFILAFFVFMFMFLVLGANDFPSRIGMVAPGTPAERAGIKPGDLITSINGTPIASFGEMAEIVSLAQGQALAVKIIRGGEAVELTVTPGQIEKDDNFGGKVRDTGIGVGPAPITDQNPMVTRHFGVLDSAINAVGRIRYIIAKTFSFLGQLLTGSGDYRQLSGPAGIAAISAQVAVAGGVTGLVLLVGVLSVSIGLLNLFPIPMLDGGHLLYYGIEAVRGRPLGERAQELGFQIGLALVVGLMLIATWSDLVKFQIF